MMAKLGLLLGLLLNAATLFAQDSLNVTRLAKLDLANGPDLCGIALRGNYLYAPE